MSPGTRSASRRRHAPPDINVDSDDEGLRHSSTPCAQTASAANILSQGAHLDMSHPSGPAHILNPHAGARDDDRKSDDEYHPHSGDEEEVEDDDCELENADSRALAQTFAGEVRTFVPTPASALPSSPRRRLTS